MSLHLLLVCDILKFWTFGFLASFCLTDVADFISFDIFALHLILPSSCYLIVAMVISVSFQDLVKGISF